MGCLSTHPVGNKPKESIEMSGVYEGIPREQIPWYPTVNTDDCTGCQECVEHCPGDVFDWDEANAYPLGARPYNCVVYCVGCAKVCPEDAISFPPKEQIVALIKELREKYASG